ncbi:DUF5681 domain-containing protein [Rhodoferax bucti]|uniref:DUF5681 domain-containing protein n=1 Tax=Rhodoferax bucti TaxID=2576305 RepID=UPI001109B51A|nr:DUF5681 domain-containing protein [Rhodoferax bucti]
MADKKDTRFKPGQSGNPNGRAPGHGEIAKLRQMLSVHVPEIIEQVIAAARGGDLQAARLVLDKVIPSVKPIDLPVGLQLPTDGSLTEQGRAVIAAVSEGQLSPSNGAQLVTALGALARVAEIDELSARIAKLEEQHAKH